MRLLGLALLASLASCLRATEFACTDSAQCGGGTCEPVGYCSFADSACATGQRFGDSAGSYAGQCTDAIGGDAGVDALADASTDAPMLGCPDNYMAVTGTSHRYRVITQSADYATQKARCAADGPNVYLAIPDDADEMERFVDLFQFSQEVWVGIDDIATEGTYVNAKGQVQTYLPWLPGQPNNNNNQDCIAVQRSAQQMNDLSCEQEQLRAACECEP